MPVRVGTAASMQQVVRVIRVMLVDRSPIFAQSLAVRLAHEEDLAVVSAGSASSETVRMLDDGAVDVAVCDEQLALPILERGGRGGPRPRPPHVVVVAERDDVEVASSVVRAGAAGWVTRDQSCDTLLGAVRAASRFETWISLGLLTGVLATLTARARKESNLDDRLSVLTDREREILQMYAQGLGAADVAERLRLSRNTVRTHVQNILGRLDVHSTLAAVALARSAPSFERLPAAGSAPVPPGSGRRAGHRPAGGRTELRVMSPQGSSARPARVLAAPAQARGAAAQSSSIRRVGTNGA
jgi:DNA-binding NarL/FixJ family response regulator